MKINSIGHVITPSLLAILSVVALLAIAFMALVIMRVRNDREVSRVWRSLEALKFSL